MRPRATITLAALLLAGAACGEKREAEQRPPAPSPAPKPTPAGPVAPPVPRILPTFITMDEIRAHQPTLTGLRMTTELALDASGKQALGSGCLTAAGAKVAMHRLADAFGVARWEIRTRATTQADARGEVIGDFTVPDGILHVRGVLAAAPTCQLGEVGLSLYYSKVAEAPAPAAPPSAGVNPLRSAPDR